VYRPGPASPGEARPGARRSGRCHMKGVGGTITWKAWVGPTSPREGWQVPLQTSRKPQNSSIENFSTSTRKFLKSVKLQKATLLQSARADWDLPALERHVLGHVEVVDVEARYLPTKRFQSHRDTLLSHTPSHTHSHTPSHVTRHACKVAVVRPSPAGLNLRTTTLQKCAAVPRRAPI